YTGDTVIVQFLYFPRDNNPAATTKDFDMTSTQFLQKVNHIFKIFNMAALIGRNSDPLGIFLNGGVNNFFNGALVPEMNHFRSAGLKNAPHNVDRCVMTIKQTRCTDKPNRMCRTINFYLFH